MKPLLRIFSLSAALLGLAGPAQLHQARAADSLPIVKVAEIQPLAAQVGRLAEAMDYIGSPLSPRDKSELEKALADGTPAAAETIQRILDPYCLVGVSINPESRVKVSAGPAPRLLLEQGWRQ